MKRYLILLSFMFSASLYAGGYNYYQDQPYDQYGNPNYRYEGPSGKKYQYDLSNPADRLRYEVDPGAQLRDEINVDPRIDLDRDLDRYGGGAKW